MTFVSDPALLEAFLAKFIVPRGNFPVDIQARMLYFVEIINDANQHKHDDQDGPKLAHTHKMAKQSLRRLVRRYPGLAGQLVHDTQYGKVAA